MKTPDQPALPERRLLPAKEVVRLTSLSKSSLRRLAEAGQFPRPIQLTKARVAWRSEEVHAWIDQGGIGRQGDEAAEV